MKTIGTLSKDELLQESLGRHDTMGAFAGSFFSSDVTKIVLCLEPSLCSGVLSLESRQAYTQCTLAKKRDHNEITDGPLKSWAHNADPAPTSQWQRARSSAAAQPCTHARLVQVRGEQGANSSKL